MSIASEISRLQNAKSDLKTAINSKTDTEHKIDDETLDEYSDFIDYIQGGVTSNIYKFSTLEEAQAKNDYNVGDIAVVMGEKKVPFYPKLWSYPTANNSFFRMFVNDNITFTEIPDINVSASWSETSGSKTNTYIVSVVIDSTTATVTIPIYTTSVINCKFVWTSQNGLTYNYSYGNYNATSTNGKVKVIELNSNTTRTNLLNTLLSNWETMNIISKFFSYTNGDIVQDYYRYDGITNNASYLDFTVPFYPYDLSSVVLNGDKEIIDILPMSTPYTIDTSWFQNFTEEGFYTVVDDGDILYLSTFATYIIDTLNNTKFIVNNGSTITTINKSTKEVSTTDISSTQYTVISSTGSSANRYIIPCEHPESCIIYTLRFLPSEIYSQLYGVRIGVYENNLNNSLSTTSSYFNDAPTIVDPSYMMMYLPYKSLGLKQIKKPDIDMCITLANSILGVS